MKGGYFLGTWLKSKVRDFKDLTPDEKLKYLDQLIFEVDYENLRKDAANKVSESYRKVIDLMGRDYKYDTLAMRAEEIKQALSEFQQLKQEYDLKFK